MPVLFADRSAAVAALSAIADPQSGKGLADAGVVKGLVVAAGRAGFALVVPREHLHLYQPVRDEAEQALARLPGVSQVRVLLVADDEAPPEPGAERLRPGARLSPQVAADTQPRRPPPAAERLPHVRHVVAVASGKGGVGKSTVAVNLAVAFGRLGLRTGLLDADIYGPSVPWMTGISGEPEIGPDKQLIPIQAWGLKIMSIGLIVDEEAPMIWRGPMASSALNQMLREVSWGSEAEPLDVLVVDLPPGTGDIQLSLIQKVVMSGAVIVSTPQEVALIDARRAIAMFAKTGVPVLGVVENMAFFPDPTTGAPIEIFGRGGARATAKALEAPFLGEIPIDPELRRACDEGVPLAASRPASAAATAIGLAAKTVAERLKIAP